MKKDNIALGLIKHIIWTNFEGWWANGLKG